MIKTVNHSSYKICTKYAIQIKSLQILNFPWKNLNFNSAKQHCHCYKEAPQNFALKETETDTTFALLKENS